MKCSRTCLWWRYTRGTPTLIAVKATVASECWKCDECHRGTEVCFLVNWSFYLLLVLFKNAIPELRLAMNSLMLVNCDLHINICM